MTNLKTQDTLIRALEQAATRRLSTEEIHNQRISFILGSVKESSGITRAQVERELAQQDGQKPR